MLPILLASLAFLAADDSTTATTTTTTGGNLTVVFDDSEHEILNVADCDDLTGEITLNLTTGDESPTDLLLSGVKFYAWRTSDSEHDCTTPVDADSEYILVDAHELGDTDGLIERATTFSFPEDGGLATASFTEATVGSWTGDDPCTTTIDHTYYKVCFAVDTVVDETGASLTIDESSEPYGWARFLVDTVAPNTPSITAVTSLDGAISITASISDEDNLGGWKVYAREQPSTDEETTDEETATNCTTDWDATASEFSTTDELTISATNGLTYELCVVATDKAGNDSEPSAIETATPEDECDFMECYPGSLRTGYCHTGLSGPSLGLLLALLIGFRLRHTPRRAS